MTGARATGYHFATMADLKKTLRVIKAAGGWTAAEMHALITEGTEIIVKPITVQRWIDGSRNPSPHIRQALIKWASDIAQEMGIAVDPAAV